MVNSSNLLLPAPPDTCSTSLSDSSCSCWSLPSLVFGRPASGFFSSLVMAAPPRAYSSPRASLSDRLTDCLIAARDPLASHLSAVRRTAADTADAPDGRCGSPSRRPAAWPDHETLQADGRSLQGRCGQRVTDPPFVPIRSP